MKQFLVIFILLLGLVGCANNTKENEEVQSKTTEAIDTHLDLDKEEERVLTPQYDSVYFDILVSDESSMLALTHFMATEPELGEHVTYSIQPYIKGRDPADIEVTEETTQVLIIPTSLGAKLYQQGSPYQLLATLSWGNLYLISQEEITLDDLAGKTITTFEQDSAYDMVFRTILSKNGLLDSVEIEYLDSESDVYSKFISGEAEIALMTEPFISTIKGEIEHVNMIADCQQQWKELYGEYSYPQVSLFLHQELIKTHPEIIEPLLAQLEASVSFANQSIDEMIQEANQIGLEISEAIIRDAVPNLYLMFKTAEEAKEEIEFYLEKLYQFNPELIGNSIPDDDFYHLVN
ncbi:MAG: ABC transporter substrate-binding protein [Turicibacter sp.]|nr:ABC transporter substrate-binding protein [Turicibacter sp.]